MYSSVASFDRICWEALYVYWEAKLSPNWILSIINQPFDHVFFRDALLLERAPVIA